MADDQPEKAKAVVDLTGDAQTATISSSRGATAPDGREDSLLNLFIKKEEQRIDVEHHAAVDLTQTVLRTVGPMTLRELLQNEILALEERHRKEDMGLQREGEQANEQSMAVSIVEAKAHATEAVEGQAGKTKQERHPRCQADNFLDGKGAVPCA
ncbi:hypothetical protein DYB38_013973 [Aphanomyces astaci]|uniref:Uncharacterized protein n=1 Tax=Aphanomyces astaci TaxID=112090 RepID=A0A397C119_APHAT|nr:hypothetical protein DYB38_013973 [Aphanomyces astaci]